MADKKISALSSASLPLAGTEVLPIVQSSTTVKVATDDLTVKNIRSNATTGILQVTGPAASSTRTMTVPNANFTAARTDAAQSFTGTQTVLAAATQDAVAIAGRAGGTSSYVSTITPTTLSANRTVTLPNADTTLPVATQVLTFSGPTAARTITLPDANFTAARTDAAQSFTGDQTLGTGNLIQGTAAKGVNFSANTPAAGATSTLLNWYEEGTWTPSITFGGAGTGITYFTQAGTYTRIGNQVTVCSQMYLNSLGSSTGTVDINGLPFYIKSNAGAYCAGSLVLDNITFSGTVSALGNIAEKRVSLYQTTTAGAFSLLSDTNFISGSRIFLTLTYFV